MAASWKLHTGDCLPWLKSLPDDSIDLLFTSPPYEDCRTYGVGFSLKGQAWVDWMVEIVKAAAPKVKGLIAINCEGKTRNYAYSGTPFLLFADLHRAGFNMRKPPIFQRVGIPGSGGPDWLRNDYEPIICATRGGQLPWSDNTACGSSPNWAVGGKMSNRQANGNRVNLPGNRRRQGDGRREDQQVEITSRMVKGYMLPEKANPGNVLKCLTGGGHMGHALAHENEAPFPQKLSDFFVKSFCPPGGVVCDPFSGSGTTMASAIEHGRNFIGCDIRESQVELAKRRIRTVTPSLIAEAEPEPEPAWL